jgi:hypothetical protein
MEEKEDQSPTINASTREPREEESSAIQGLGEISRADQAEGSELTPQGAPCSSLEEEGEEVLLRGHSEEEKKREVDLNVLFPGKGYDLNRLFPDEETKKLLYELRRNKRDIERFVKNLELEE